MSEVRKIATRESYGNALVELGEQYNNVVVLDSDLAAATKTSIFRSAFPKRHINCGIAESNMMSIAAGMATTGFVPFVSSFAMFAAGRAYEQVRNSIAYPNLNVKIGATHAGISVGEDGATHQCNEDIALMRTIPNMTIISPSDDIETKEAIMASYKIDGPVYLRLSRLPVPIINDRPSYKFEVGKGDIIQEGNAFTIITTGICVSVALEVAKLFEKENIDVQVVNMHTIKPLDNELVIKCAMQTGRIITVEEHSVIGGLGGAVCEVLSESFPVPVKRIGIYDTFGQSGPAIELIEKYQLDSKGVYTQIKPFIEK